MVVAVVFHEVPYGGAIDSTPRFPPSSLNCTPATPTLSDASAVTATVCATLDPLAGDVIATTGATASVGPDVNVTIDTVTQIQSHLLAHQYGDLIKKARLKGGMRR